MSPLHRTDQRFTPLCRLLVSYLLCAMLPACGGSAKPDTPALTPTPPAVLTTPPLSLLASTVISQQLAPGVVIVQVSLDKISTATGGVGRLGGAPLNEGDLMPLGSNTKPMTATLAALLVQDGKLSWDARLLDVLPELRAGVRPDYADVTLSDLLAHRAGIYEGTTIASIAALPDFVGASWAQRLEFASWALSQARPAAGYAYSNGGYVIAAAMLERASGKDYETLLRERLLQPLGMNASFGPPGAGGPQEPVGHLRSADGKSWVVREGNAPEAYFPPFAYPAGALKASAPGVGRFLQMHLRALSGRTGELITPASAAVLHRFDAAGQGGLGWVAGKQSGVDFSWHSGSDDASYDALFFVSKQTSLAAAIMINGYDTNSFSNMVNVIFPLIK